MFLRELWFIPLATLDIYIDTTTVWSYYNACVIIDQDKTLLLAGESPTFYLQTVLLQTVGLFS